MSWVTLSILAALIWSVVNISDKYIVSKLVKKPMVIVVVLGVIGLIISLLIATFSGFKQLSAGNIILAFVAGLLFVLMSLFYFKAAKLEEISRVVPLFYLAPVFILFIAGFSLGEVFTPLKYLGIVLLVAGAILISSKKGLFRFSKAFWLMVLSALCLAINQVITKYLLGFADFWTIFGYIRIGAFLALVPVICLGLSAFKNVYRESGMRGFGVISITELLNLGAILCATLATAIGFVTLTNALSAIQPFFILVLTVLVSIFYPQILKEEVTKSTVSLKLISIIMMFTGAILIT